MPGPVPTVIVTWVPLFTVVPAFGACVITLPMFDGDDGTCTTRTSNAAPVRVLVASAWVSPITFGTLTWSGPVETNLVWIAVAPTLGTASEVAARLRDRGVLVSPLGPQVIRACTHLDVSRDDDEYAAGEFRRLAADGD